MLGGAVRWCAWGRVGGRRLFVCTTAHRSESLRTRLVWRLAAACGGHLKSKTGPPAAPARRAALAPGRGAALLGAGRCLWSPCPGFPVASSPDGSRPVRWYQVGPLLLWCGFVRLDTTGPVSLATPADATGNPGQPRPVVWTRSTRARTPAGGDVARPRCGNPSHSGGCPGSLVAVGGACTTIPDWRGQAGRNPTTAACDAALPRQAGMVPFRATSATRDPGLGDQHSDRRRGGGLGIPQSLECPRRRRLLLILGTHHARRLPPT
ncbi:hypothetical protein ABH920_004469 [Catenulispora sp. EB89]